MNRTNEDLLQRKKNLKWFHSRIEDFNNEVPYQVNVLIACKNNVRKQYRLENFTAVRQERMAAERTIRSLKKLLADIEELRTQVIDADLDKFDKLVNQSRERINSSLDSFNKYYDSLPLGNGYAKLALTSNSYANDDGPDHDDTATAIRQDQVMMHQREDRYQLEIAEEVENIEKNSEALNEIFKDLAQIIDTQKESVDKIEDQVEQSHAHVISAQKELAQVASRMQGAVYPLLGAILGSCVAGPIGLVAGLKVGAVVAVTGSVIGFSSGKVLKNRQQKLQREIAENEENVIRI